ncbi:transforming growth factor beta like domain protein [Ostertagia ostertagi]
MNRALLVCVSVVLTLSTQVSAFLPLSPHELDMIQKDAKVIFVKKISTHLNIPGFLRRFGFSDVPNQSGPALPIPDHVWDIYEKAKEDENIDWIRHYYPKVITNAAHEEVTRADLKIRVHSAKRHSSQINVYELDEKHPEIRKVSRPRSWGRPLLHATRTKSEPVVALNATRQSQWFDFDVTSAFHSPRSDHDTVVFLIEHPGVDVYTSEPHSMSAVPFTRHQSFPLIVYSALKEPSRVRRKRAAAPPRRDRKKQRKQHHRNATDSGICQKKALYVDFEEIGWQEWILAPRNILFIFPESYEAGQCVGVCPHPLPSHLNATNHAIVQSLTNSLNPQIPPPCCVPTETTHLSILFLDVDNKWNYHQELSRYAGRSLRVSLRLVHVVRHIQQCRSGVSHGYVRP